MQTPEIKELPALTVVGLEIRFRTTSCENPSPVIPQLWDDIVKRWPEIPHNLNTGSYGIVSRIPEAQRSHPDEMLYLAGAQVSQVEPLPAGMIVKEIPPSTWAIFTHTGPITRIGETLKYIYDTWLPASGCQLTGLPDVELYDDRFCGGGDNAVMEYRLSVVPSAVESCQNE